MVNNVFYQYIVAVFTKKPGYDDTENLERLQLSVSLAADCAHLIS